MGNIDVIALIIAYGPWSWMVAGLVLLALELVVPGGIFLWLGFSGIVTGIAAFIPGLPWPLQFVIFGILALVSVAGWLRYTHNRPDATDKPFLNQRARQFIGREAVIEEPIKDGYGKIALDDSIWRISGPDLAAGQRVRVTGANGAVLQVEPV
jgi:membrane protein implicated in regulation of membrane protease activity